MNKTIPYILVLAFFNVSCSLYKINSEEITENVYSPKKSSAEVEYLQEIKRPVEVIGYITVNAERNQKIDEIIGKIKREAAILGADAITDIQTGASDAWKKLPLHKLLENGYIRANFKATAVAYQ